MPQSVKISIVIPVYNVAPYIAECLQSVKQQTWQGWLECIIVDDCGTDDSMAIVKRELEDYNGKIHFRIVHHEKNLGLSAARNSGLDAVQGDYVYFLDSDDEITPDCIECLASPLENENYELIVGDYRIVGENAPKPPLLLSNGTSLYDGEILHAYRELQWYMLSVNKLYQVAFLNRHHLRFYEGVIHEDELWSFQIACLARSLHAVGHECYIYKVRAGSITVKRNNEHRCYSIHIILREMYEFSQRHHLQNNQDVYNYLQNFRMIMMYSIYSEAPAYFKGFYTEQRQAVWMSWRECFKRDGLDIRKQLRDLHQLMPVWLSVAYLKMMFRFF